MNTRIAMVAVVVGAMMLTGCLIVPGPHGRPKILVPPHPGIGQLETEPYSVQGGYAYFLRDNGWYDSRQRNGPWAELPRDQRID